MNVEEFMPDDLDVQKAVVESLAADKAEQDEQISDLSRKNENLKAEIDRLKNELEQSVSKMNEMKKALDNVGDILSRNAESTTSSQISLLDRDPDLNDRFPGETREQVLEVIREAREAAEKEGRIRRAQIMESVLVANEPTGSLAKKRQALTKFFSENGNILTGPVIEELQKCGITYKNGEDYLLPTEILKRIY